MTTQGRSISSTIVDFFKRPLDRKNGVDDYSDLLREPYGPEIAVEDHGSEISDGLDGRIPHHQRTLVPMDDEKEYRPPIVSILPVERLRLLRQRQEWRRRIESNVFLTMVDQPSLSNRGPTVPQPRQSELLGVDNTHFSFEPSNTPSPVKQDMNTVPKENDMTLRLRPLKKKKISETKRRGTKWSADFEYDLAEYDHIPRQKIENQDSIDDSGIDSPRLSIVKNVCKGIASSQEGNTGDLSALQRSILLNGPDSVLMKKSGQDLKLDSKKENYSSKVTLSFSDDSNHVKKTEKEKLISPSIGFDFVKDNDTPPKRASADAALETQTKPSFSFAAQPKEVDKLNTSQFSAASNPQKAQKTSAVPALNSVNKTKRGDDKQEDENEDEDEEEELRRKKPTLDRVTNSIRPSFSFGKKSAEEEGKKISFTFEGSKDKKSANNVVPSFSFTQKDTPTPTSIDLNNSKAEGKTKPSFSFSGSRSEKGDEKEKPSLFADKTSNDNTGAQKMPSFSFSKANGKTTGPLNLGVPAAADSISKTGFSFGSSKSGKIVSPKPSFNFGDKNETSSKPLLSFGAQEKTESAAKPTFSFGKPNNNDLESKPGFSAASGSTTIKDDTAGSKLSFSFNAANGSSSGFSDQDPSKLTKSNILIQAKEGLPNEAGGSKINFSLPTKDQHKAQTEESTNSGGFSFSRIPGQPDTSTKSISFSSGANGGGFSSGNDLKQPSLTAPQVQTSATGPFSFNRPDVPTINNNAVSGSVPGANQPSFNFKLDSGVTKPNAPIASASIPSGVGGANPFIGGTSGFSFGSANANTNSNGLSAAFENTHSLQAPIGGSTTPSPAFGQSATPPVPASNPPSRTFTPSNTINLNFGSSVAGNPSSIFSGAPQQATGVVGGNPPVPQQIFGGTPPPSQIFGGAAQQPGLGFNNAQPAFGNMNNDTSLTQPSMQAPATNFQLPPGRKLARMRHSRRG